MTDTKWRISGGIGVPPDQETGQRQNMTQGLGFPLRPVDNVPAQDAGDIFENIDVAEGIFMTLIPGGYVPGRIYPAGSVVNDTGWLMAALTTTVTKPAPVPDGDPSTGLPATPTWSTESQEAVVYTGHYYEFTTGGWAKQLKVWVPELSTTTHYRIILYDVTDPNFPIYKTIEEPILNEDDWTIVTALNDTILPGTKLFIYLDALNSGSDSLVTGGWTYGGPQNTIGPALGQWNNRTQQDILRINTTDLDSTDRTTELEGMIPDTNVVFSETGEPNRSITYRIEGAGVTQVGYIEYPVTLISQGPLGAPLTGEVTTMTATVPIALPTQYVELAAGVPTPTWATVTGFKQYDGVDQGGDANGYGIDLEFQPATVSADWYALSFTEL